jgi:hypothetical protein
LLWCRDQFSPKEFQVVQQLAIAPEMRRVWHQLSLYKARPEGLKACGADSEGDEKVLWDRAVARFFLCAIPARSPDLRSVQTPKDRATSAAPWASAAELCRRANEDFPTSPDLATALVRVANYFDHVARQEARVDSPLVVQRHNKKRSDDQARAYVRVLGHLTRDLFGSVLTRTVATTATVALERSITERQVRNWTAN